MMAELARMAAAARPCLLSPLRRPAHASTTTTTMASLYLGLGLGHNSRSISSTIACPSKKPMAGPSASAKRALERRRAADMQSTTSWLLPFTIVPPPLWRWPRSPIKLCQMIWFVGRNRCTSLATLVGVYFMSSKDRGWKWPIFRAGKSAAVPAAKALQVQMCEAVAAGDRETLRRICANELFQLLAAAIDARPADVRTEWELVRYEYALRYPRLADFRVTYQPHPTNKSLRLVKQAVVSIASVQRLTRYAKSGQKIPGSDRERHMIEHFVIQAQVKQDTYEAGPWQIWGTLPEMSYETMAEDTKIFEETMAMRAHKGSSYS